MTLVISVLCIALGWVLRAAIKVEPSPVVLERAADDWTQLPNGVRERLCWSQAQARGLMDRCAAKDREIATLTELLRGYRVEEAGVERELRLVK